MVYLINSKDKYKIKNKDRAFFDNFFVMVKFLINKRSLQPNSFCFIRLIKTISLLLHLHAIADSFFQYVV